MKKSRKIIDRGQISEEGAFHVLAEGETDGKPIRITNQVNAPGLIEAVEKPGLTHEYYLTDQCAFIFTKMLVNDVFQKKGAIAPEKAWCRPLFETLSKNRTANRLYTTRFHPGM
jgi:hypothetical protein